MQRMIFPIKFFYIFNISHDNLVTTFWNSKSGDWNYSGRDNIAIPENGDPYQFIKSVGNGFNGIAFTYNFRKKHVSSFSNLPIVGDSNVLSAIDGKS